MSLLSAALRAHFLGSCDGEGCYAGPQQSALLRRLVTATDKLRRTRSRALRARHAHIEGGADGFAVLLGPATAPAAYWLRRYAAAAVAAASSGAAMRRRLWIVASGAAPRRCHAAHQVSNSGSTSAGIKGEGETAAVGTGTTARGT